MEISFLPFSYAFFAFLQPAVFALPPFPDILSIELSKGPSATPGKVSVTRKLANTVHVYCTS